MQRRTLLSAAAGALTSGAQSTPMPIIDTHIHLFDTSRPQGIPWPPKTNQILYKTALPARYRDVVKGLGVVGAIEVEASPWFEDNQWVLDVMEKDPIMVGMIGNLEPGNPEFASQLEKLHKNPLYLGIRYGNLWGRNLGDEISKPDFTAGLKRLAQAGLVLDSANPNMALLGALVRTAAAVPDLRIVVDHLPNMPLPREAAARKDYDRLMRELAAHRNVYFKVSEVVQPSIEQDRFNLNHYRERIDQMWDSFGPDRLLYGSDWPNSDPRGTYPQVLGVVQEYFRAKGKSAEEKYFWRNSLKVYRWVKRTPEQKRLTA